MVDNDFQQELSKNVWSDTYKWETDIRVNDTYRRTSKCIASKEKRSAKWEEIFYSLLSNKRYVPAGRILSNAGVGLKSTSFINCFVSGFKDASQDSIKSIYSELKRQAQILASEGGYGFCCDVLRPRGSYINGIGVGSPGSVEFLKLWDTSSQVITMGSGLKSTKGKGKIRKGAMMVTKSIWHPDIEEFITAKREEGVLTKFNMSVLVSNKFMEACKKNKKWDLEFPDTLDKMYNKFWDGNLEKWKEKGYAVKIYKTFNNANELFDIILKSTYNYNEPGVLFIDRINELNNLNYCEHINATNPCGEQPLPNNGSCNLGSINLVKYINSEKTDYDYDSLKKDIPAMLRLQDNVNDLTVFPLTDQKKKAINTRRVGIGYMGYGSSLYIMKIPYGSKEALKLTNKLCSFVTNELYTASALLAKEKSKFPRYIKKKYLESRFIKQALTKETIDLIKKHGIRNSHITTIAPTGNTSILTDLVSGGLEPVVSPKYIRTVIINCYPDGLSKPKNIDWSNKQYEGDPIWIFVKEGKDDLLRTVYSDVVYKIDKNRGLTYENTVYDYAVFQNIEKFKIDEENKEEYIKTVFNLSIKEHIDTMKIFAKYIDSSISKTINFPEDISFEEFKNVYLDAYNSNTIKGITTYRNGTMASVIKVEDDTEVEPSIDRREAPKRPIGLDCDIHEISVQGVLYIVLIGLLGGSLYEIFVTTNQDKKIDMEKHKTGIIIKKGKGRYSLIAQNGESKIIIENINDEFDSIPSTLSRFISMALRHGTPLEFVVEQLARDRNFLGIERAISRILKKYIKDGEKLKISDKCDECGGDLIFQEGCVKCISCGVSKCS